MNSDTSRNDLYILIEPSAFVNDVEEFVTSLRCCRFLIVDTNKYFLVQFAKYQWLSNVPSSGTFIQSQLVDSLELSWLNKFLELTRLEIHTLQGEELRSWIESQSNIAPQDQIIESIHNSVLLINLNSFELTNACILDLKASGDDSQRIYVIDNGSKDVSKLRLFLAHPEVIFISLVFQASYCSAFNVVADKAIRDGCEFLFFLNNDTRGFSNGLVSTLIANLSNEISIISPRVYDFESGDIHWQPRKKLNIPFDIATEGYLMSAETWKLLDGFNNSYSVYFEDLHLIERLRKYGKDGALYAEVSMEHLGGGTSSRMLFVPVYYNLRNTIWIQKEHYGTIWKWIIFINLWVRIKSIFKRKLFIDGNFSLITLIKLICFTFVATIAGIYTKSQENSIDHLDGVMSRTRPELKFMIK